METPHISPNQNTNWRVAIVAEDAARPIVGRALNVSAESISVPLDYALKPNRVYTLHLEVQCEPAPKILTLRAKAVTAVLRSKSPQVVNLFRFETACAELESQAH